MEEREMLQGSGVQFGGMLVRANWCGIDDSF